MINFAINRKVVLEPYALHSTSTCNFLFKLYIAVRKVKL